MIPMDSHSRLPSGMVEYLDNYGFHFSKKACEFAVSQMKGRDGGKFTPWEKEQVEELLNRYGIKLEKKKGYDHVFIANMAKADFLKSSLPDEQHIAMYVKDYLDDPDGTDELPFRRWLASMVGLGIPVMWEDIM